MDKRYRLIRWNLESAQVKTISMRTILSAGYIYVHTKIKKIKFKLFPITIRPAQRAGTASIIIILIKYFNHIEKMPFLCYEDFYYR